MDWFACNTQNNCVVLPNLPLWVCDSWSSAEEMCRGGKLNLYHQEDKTTQKVFSLLLQDKRNSNIHLSDLSVIKSNVAYKPHSDICLGMPTQSHSQMYLRFHQPQHSQNVTFPSRRWHGTACDFALQLTHGMWIKSKVCFAKYIFSIWKINVYTMMFPCFTLQV